VKSRILVLDDDSYTRLLFEELLGNGNVELHTASNVAEARRAFRSTDFNLAILDQRLPDGNGLDFFTEIRSERPQQMAILITGYAEVRDAVRAVRAGLFDYQTKPFENLDELEAVIEKALEMDRAYREIANLRETLAVRPNDQVVIGGALSMQKILAQVRQAAPLDTTVLIEGESGTGKEVIAKQIHGLSRRAKQPLLELNCGSLSESLLESTLFGYEKGAYTGATKATPGYLESANGGTLFLDEIADMSQKLQASLLRVLQEHTYTRLGSTTPQRCDFRLICATNKSLEGEMTAGRFRPDLYYRINVVGIHLPPLRERQEDIAPLALFFLDYFNRKFDKAAGPITPEAMALLEANSWPGNVRELKHTIERAVVVNANGPVTPACFQKFAANIQASDSAALTRPFREARDIFERTYFTNLLQATAGNVSEAARKSELARKNFYVHIERLGLVAKS